MAPIPPIPTFLIVNELKSLATQRLHNMVKPFFVKALANGIVRTPSHPVHRFQRGQRFVYANTRQHRFNTTCYKVVNVSSRRVGSNWYADCLSGFFSKGVSMAAGFLMATAMARVLPDQKKETETEVGRIEEAEEAKKLQREKLFLHLLTLFIISAQKERKLREEGQKELDGQNEKQDSEERKEETQAAKEEEDQKELDGQNEKQDSEERKEETQAAKEEEDQKELDGQNEKQDSEERKEETHVAKEEEDQKELDGQNAKQDSEERKEEKYAAKEEEDQTELDGHNENHETEKQK